MGGGGGFWLFQQILVFIVFTDPKPILIVAFLQGLCPISTANTNRPKLLANLLKMQRGMK
jgi:hypothetical protein